MKLNRIGKHIHICTPNDANKICIEITMQNQIIDNDVCEINAPHSWCHAIYEYKTIFKSSSMEWNHFGDTVCEWICYTVFIWFHRSLDNHANESTHHRLNWKKFHKKKTFWQLQATFCEDIRRRIGKKQTSTTHCGKQETMGDLNWENNVTYLRSSTQIEICERTMKRWHRKKLMTTQRRTHSHIEIINQQ